MIENGRRLWKQLSLDGRCVDSQNHETPEKEFLKLILVIFLQQKLITM